ncbi:hypothetical protein CHS0354_037203 [Potamilus streckersoni]|uniref:Fibrinogen C-terminal domain-containing protein n=1 Tax=Potamilus streckersoni TaxID=2493646 RepID=A0AAE0W4A0_9BIVA|nr:hypothetical protein CHS0354_037203 [Potamilus streckersoni]
MQFDQVKQIFLKTYTSLLDNSFRNFRNLLDLDTEAVDYQDIRSIGYNLSCRNQENKGLLRSDHILQRRFNGSVEFNRTRAEYEIGFGDLEGELWLGWYELRIDLVYRGNQKWFAKYNVFRVADTNNKYRLELDGYSGTVGNSMIGHYGKQFSAGNSMMGHYRKLFSAGHIMRDHYGKQFSAGNSILGHYGKQFSVGKSMMGHYGKQFSAGKSMMGHYEKQFSAGNSMMGHYGKQFSTGNSMMGHYEKQFSATD